MFPKIFSGVKVLDFSRLLPGPFASELLIKMGAEVRCVIPREGDPLLGAYSPFEALRQGKSFEEKNLKDPKDLAEVKGWLGQSQILLEGFRPGAMDRLGLGFQEAAKINPQILYVSLSGYGEKDEKFLKGAHDLNFLIDAGIYSILFEDHQDTIPIFQLADVFGGFYAAFLILTAWVEHQGRPKAQHIRAAIVEGLKLLPEYLKGSTLDVLLPALTGQAARYHIYRTKEGKRVFIGAIEGKFFRNLMTALGLAYGDHEEGPEVVAAIQKKFGEKTLEEWKKIFKDVDACVSFIPGREEVLS